MRTFRCLLIGIATASVWPGYIGLAAYAARQAPWPRSTALATGTVLGLLALALLSRNLILWLFAEGGWAERELGVPSGVNCQVRRTGLALVIASVAFMIPYFVLSQGLFSPAGRPFVAPAIDRLLMMAFELCVLAIALRVTRRHAPLALWLADFPDRLGWLNRYRHAVATALVTFVVLVIGLDARGYSYTARRLATGVAGSAVAASVAWCCHRLIVRTIDRHAWRWIRLGKALAGLEAPGTTSMPHDVAERLRLLSGYLGVALSLFLATWAWDVDLAFFRFVSEQPLWSVDGKEVYVTVGDIFKAFAIFFVTAVVWKNISTCLAVAVFPRMPDDPGVRFAIVTLCRYSVLGIGMLTGLTAVHLGLEKIGVVLAALGVGLGFGLQEIVSNFVCGIILLLERPIRVGDIVTVAGMTGKVDRINIRATTIINGDNQSMIVPNRAFITGDLVNWTLKDKVIRITLRVRVAVGTDPDRVSELLLSIARDDVDVLRNPLPQALMEDFSDSSLIFVLHAHVPDPGLGGRARHRLFAAIQRRFDAEGILIPLPTQKLLLTPADVRSGEGSFYATDLSRVDAADRQPPAPHWATPRPVNETIDGGHRGVDE